MNTLFWRKLDTLLKHRLPLMNALEILLKEVRAEREKKFLLELIQKLKAGISFAKSAAPNDEVIQGMLEAGERAGDLSGVVARLALREEERRRLKNQIRGAMLYPALILFLCVALCAVLSAIVLPRFEKLFVSLGVGGTLPPLTLAVLSFGKFVRACGWWVLPLVGFGVVSAFLFLKKKRPMLFWRLPLMGVIWRQSHLEIFFSTLSLLIKSGATLDDALIVCSRGLVNTPLQKVCETAALRVKEGERLSSILRASNFFEESQLQMIALAEETADLPDSCARLSALLQENLREKIKSTISLLEPALILTLAGVVALMVASLFLPLGPLVAKLAEGA
jgi:type II secretory pathway component PulF